MVYGDMKMIKCSIVGCKKEGKHWKIHRKTGTDFIFCDEHRPPKRKYNKSKI